MRNKRFYWKLVSMFLILIFVNSVFVSAAEYSFTYDANGNMLQGKNNYREYNEFNQLIRVKESNSTGRILSEYVYDHEGNRIRKIKYASDGSNETTYYFDKSFIRMVNASGTYDTVYYHDGEGNLIGRKDYDGKKYFYLLDHLGSVVKVLDETGNVVETIDYLPFGEEYVGGGEEADSRYKFTGKERDSDTGLDYFKTRYYDSGITRFIQPDSTIPDVYNPQSLNRYVYTLNNPYRYVDEQGNFATLPAAAIGAGIGALIGGGYAFYSEWKSTSGSWSQMDKGYIVKSAGIGAVGGGVTGLTLGLGTAAFGSASTTAAVGELGLAGKTGLVILSNLIGYESEIVTKNLIEGKQWDKGVMNPKDLKIGGTAIAGLLGVTRLGEITNPLVQQLIKDYLDKSKTEYKETAKSTISGEKIYVDKEGNQVTESEKKKGENKRKK